MEHPYAYGQDVTWAGASAALIRDFKRHFPHYRMLRITVEPMDEYFLYYDAGDGVVQRVPVVVRTSGISLPPCRPSMKYLKVSLPFTTPSPRRPAVARRGSGARKSRE